MAEYTPVELPHFAPSPVPLPTYEQIVALAKKNPSWLADILERHIVTIDQTLLVKYGKTVDLVEGDNMLMMRQKTSIPVPAVYALYQHQPSGDNVIIMEYIPGRGLNSCYSELDSEQKASIGAQLRSQLTEMRSVPSPDFYGLPADPPRPYLVHPWIFRTQVGPFGSATEFLNEYFKAQFSGSETSVFLEIQDMKAQFLELSKNHSASVLTHADLQAHNIILRPDGSICIIDWESAGYYPQYFEFFIRGTYDMTVSGLSEDSRDHFLEYADMVSLIKKIWGVYEAWRVGNDHT
ncbi:kinase-like domain-containing protein [Nemania sp. FL0916]|nr:kinase-like domain-containing protein [Nemania sp. FL0916]